MLTPTKIDKKLVMSLLNTFKTLQSGGDFIYLHKKQLKLGKLA